MSRILKVSILLAFSLVCSLPGRGITPASKPLWIRQGEEVMNGKRISDDYKFKIFHTWDADLTLLKEKRFEPLLAFVADQYGADPLTMALDSLVTSDSGEVTYRVTFKDAAGDGVVYARKADEYLCFDDFETNNFCFELYQLFAVSDKNIKPVFDEFIVRDSDNSLAMVLSIAPGVGQLYKGEKFKGYAIMGTELFFTAGAIVSHVLYLKYSKNADNLVPYPDSWRSKATSCKVARNILVGSFASVWIYNILDAAVLPGMSRVVVKEPDGGQLTVAPSSFGPGVALTYRF